MKLRNPSLAEESTSLLKATKDTLALIRHVIEQVVKIKSWIEELRELTELAKQEPQVTYSAYTFRLCKRWIYLMRTTPNISELLLPLEKAIKHEFLTTIIGEPFSDDEYTYSRTVTTPLIEVINSREVGNFVHPERHGYLRHHIQGDRRNKKENSPNEK